MPDYASTVSPFLEADAADQARSVAASRTRQAVMPEGGRKEPPQHDFVGHFFRNAPHLQSDNRSLPIAIPPKDVGPPQAVKDVAKDVLQPITDAGWWLGGLMQGTEKFHPIDAMGAGMGLAGMFIAPPAARVGSAIARAGETAAADVAKGIRAYHGSPHDFDRFDMSKIGTGEGAQAYGHGLYFAEHEPVALDYRNRLSSSVDHLDPRSIAARVLVTHDSPEAAIRALETRLKFSDPHPQTDALAKAVDLLKNGERPSSGHMYEVNIKANPQRFLDWDAPLALQPHIQGLIDKEFGPGALTKEATGASAHNVLSGGGSLKEEATAKLREAGVPGIKYLDQGSRFDPASIERIKGEIAVAKQQARRNTGTNPEQENYWNTKAADLEQQYQSAINPTSNYVVFDDKLIDILRKYGLSGLTAGSAALGQIINNNAPPQQ